MSKHLWGVSPHSSHFCCFSAHFQIRGDGTKPVICEPNPWFRNQTRDLRNQNRRWCDVCLLTWIQPFYKMKKVLSLSQMTLAQVKNNNSLASQQERQQLVRPKRQGTTATKQPTNDDKGRYVVFCHDVVVRYGMVVGTMRTAIASCCQEGERERLLVAKGCVFRPNSAERTRQDFRLKWTDGNNEGIGQTTDYY